MQPSAGEIESSAGEITTSTGEIAGGGTYSANYDLLTSGIEGTCVEDGDYMLHCGNQASCSMCANGPDHSDLSMDPGTHGDATWRRR